MRALLLALTLAGCAALPENPAVPALLLGEQHDAAQHQRLHREVIRRLAGQGRLSAVVLEMAQQGGSTAGLPPSATEAQVQAALQWNTQAWPWDAYGPAVMAAVAAGVPVHGANLTREQMRSAMADGQLDQALPGQALQAQRDAIRAGHCGMLPETQIAPMARVQIARDRAMAQAVAANVSPGKTVVLLAGAAHVDPQLGVPAHLPRTLQARSVVHPQVTTGKDYCALMRQQMPRAS